MSDKPIGLQFSSRITIMDGEVVTFAARFKQVEGTFGPDWDALGPFEVSASRNAVVVHRAECRSTVDVRVLLLAIAKAEEARAALADQHVMNRKRLFQREPQTVQIGPTLLGSEAFNRAICLVFGWETGGGA
ncbi:MAG: hypothetical protein IOD15_00100 [Phycisphaerales bacterium]|nr:hypothetical protein [Phycisphaerales bacterium]